MCAYMFLYTYTCVYTYIYIYIHTLFFPKLFILVVQGLCCCAQVLVESVDFFFVAMSGLLVMVVSLVQHRL